MNHLLRQIHPSSFVLTHADASMLSCLCQENNGISEYLGNIFRFARTLGYSALQRKMEILLVKATTTKKCLGLLYQLLHFSYKCYWADNKIFIWFLQSHNHHSVAPLLGFDRIIDQNPTQSLFGLAFKHDFSDCAQACNKTTTVKSPTHSCCHLPKDVASKANKLLKQMKKWCYYYSI